jgi:hypothetical protein
MTTVPNKRDSRPRLPECMFCVHDHLAPGLPAGPPALLTRYARHAHDAGCGIWPGLRLLSRELRASPVTVRQWRDWLQERRLIQRLPRAGPHGTDLLRLGTCDDCRQRDSMQSRCDRCQHDNLQHAEIEWWAAQRDFMQSQKTVVQGEPTGTSVIPDRRPPTASPDGDGRPGAPRRPPDTPSSRRQAADPLSSQQQPAQQATAGAVLPFQARPPTAGTRRGAARTRSRDAPGAPTGEPFSNPTEAVRR